MAQAQDGDRNMSIADLVAEQVKKTPDVISLIYDGLEESSCHRITYSEMWQRASQVFEEMQIHGAERQTIGVCIEPGVNLPSILLGILRASSSYFPFGVDGSGFVKQSLQKLGVSYLMLDGSTLQSLQSLLIDVRVKIISSKRLQCLGVYLGQIQWGEASDGQLKAVPGLAYCITTSGTTGTPKVVRVPHACIVPNILHFRKEFQPSVGDVTFLTSPLTFDPSVIDIFMTLSSGAALLVVDTVVKTSGGSLLSMLSSKHKVTILQITPTLFGRLDPGRVRTSLLGADSALRVLAFGGETFPDWSMLGACLHPDNSTNIYNVYGITEVSCWATVHCARPADRSLKEAVPIGEALTGTRIKVVDEQGVEIKNGVGHILIGGSERTCLLNEEEEEVLRGGCIWRRTGDLGSILSDGTIFCLGREDRQIKRHGKRLDLETLEKVCCQLTTVDECRAVHREGKLLLFYKTSAEGDREEDERCGEVRCHLRSVLPSQYQPDSVARVASFPVNLHGKLDVTALVRQLKNKSGQQPPSSTAAVESWSCKLWQDIIGDQRKTVSPSDNFLTCGGDSLKAVRLVEQVEQHLGHDVPDLLDVVLIKTFSEFLVTVRQHLRSNGLAEKNQNVRSHKNRHVPARKHDSDNHLEPSEPPAKVRKSASQNSNGDDRILLNLEHCSNDKNSNVSTRNLVKQSFHGRDLADQAATGTSPEKQYYEHNGKTKSLSESSSQDNGVLSGHEHCSSDTESKVSKYNHTKQSHHGKAVVEQAAAAEGRASLSSLDQKSTTYFGGDTPTAEEDTFVGSVSRASRCWSSGGSVGHDVISNGNNGCSAAGEERDRNAIQLELQWTCDTGKCVDASPLVGRTRNGRVVVFIGSHSHRFFAVDLSSGAVLWSVELGDRVESSACLSPCGRRVVVGCYDHRIYVLKVDTGEVEWQVTTGDVVKCSPVADPLSHLVLCGSHDGFLYALHCRKQRVEWRGWIGGGGVFASPVVTSDGSVVYAATLGGHVTAVSAATGTAVWSVSLGKPVFSSPAVHGGLLLVACVDSCLHCLSSTTGLKMWTYRTEAPIFSSPVITTTCQGLTPCILLGSHDSCLHCISDAGHLVWKHRMTSTVYSSPFVFCLCDVLRDTASGDVHASHHGDEAEAQAPWRRASSLCQSQHSEESVPANGFEIKHDLRTDISTNNAKLQSTPCRTSLHSGIDDRGLVCQGGLKNGETGQESYSGQTRKKRVLSAQGVKQQEKQDKSEVFSTMGGAGDGHVVCEQLVACASTNGLVRILCCATGKEMGQKTLPGEVFSSPVIAGDRLIVGCRDDRVYCYKLTVLRNAQC
ncbi:beta-alanine-activating enzyme-like [Babylonia areolata]|uniref:beta-alanine-activating enzyme-like n=1 Tax=Babylonia areolata TaxID=304850 RepID=UPI003FCF2E01